MLPRLIRLLPIKGLSFQYSNAIFNVKLTAFGVHLRGLWYRYDSIQNPLPLVSTMFTSLLEDRVSVGQ